MALPPGPATTALHAGLVLLATAAGAQATQETVPGTWPAFEDLYDYRETQDPKISPDGEQIAYLVRTADWADNRSDRELYLRTVEGEPRQLTDIAEGSAGPPAWSPDSRFIGFLADRGRGRQIHLADARSGDVTTLTDVDGGIVDFAWSPDGRRMAVTISETISRFGDRQGLTVRFEVAGRPDPTPDHLWIFGLPPDLDRLETPVTGTRLRRLTGGTRFSVDDFAFSPDGSRIAFSHVPTADQDARYKDDISIVEVETGDVAAVVSQPGEDESPVFSPDGRSLAFSTKAGRPLIVAMERLATVDIESGQVELLDVDPVGEARPAAWSDHGILFTIQQGVTRALHLYDESSDRVARLPGGPDQVWDVDVSPDGDRVVFTGESAQRFSELFVAERVAGGYRAARRLSSLHEEQFGDWPELSGEVIEWRVDDETRIQGILYPPVDRERGGPRALLVVLHGGPIGTDRPKLVHDYVYPVEEWQTQGAWVLMVNYRGSDGYGEPFRAAITDGMGVVDAADVLAGIDHLVSLELVDTQRVGVMGWSAGGHLSASLALRFPGRFRAASVGAAVTDFRDYHMSTDNTPFTYEYFHNETPWSDPGAYAEASAISYVSTDAPPILIQAGADDDRVPVSNSQGLYRALKTLDRTTALILYDAGHGIGGLRDRVAARWHNWLWFQEHLFGVQGAWDETGFVPTREERMRILNRYRGAPRK